MHILYELLTNYMRNAPKSYIAALISDLDELSESNVENMTRILLSILTRNDTAAHDRQAEIARRFLAEYKSEHRILEEIAVQSSPE